MSMAMIAVGGTASVGGAVFVDGVDDRLAEIALMRACGELLLSPLGPVGGCR